jgi:hypothetical protein
MLITSSSRSQIAFDQGKTVQALMCEAVNRIFIENGLPGIAQ